MSDHSGSVRFQALFGALHEYEKQTDITLLKHPLAEQLQHCDSVDSITAILQEQVHACSKLRGRDRIIKSLNGAVSVLSKLSADVNLGLLSSLAKAIYAGLAVLLATVKDVVAHGPLLELLESIESFLKHLGIYTEISPTKAMTETVVKTLVGLICILGWATKLIKQGQPDKIVRKLSEGKYEEMALERLDRLTLDEARMTAAQILEVIYRLVQNTRVAIIDGMASIYRVWAALELMHNILSDVNKSKRDNLGQAIRSWLSVPEPRKNFNVARRSRHGETGMWFVQGHTFTEWKWSGPSSLLWIYGIPGAGKSVLCSTIIQDIDTMRRAGLLSLAFFYFDFREEKKKGLRGLVSSLLVQLCRQSNYYHDRLFKFYLEHAPGFHCPSDDTLVGCLKDLLKLPGLAPVYIIVDALDECPNIPAVRSPRQEVLNLIELLIKSQFPNLRICVTSRPETNIKDILDPLTFRPVSLPSEPGHKKDIMSYIKLVINMHPKSRMWQEEHKQLVIEVLTKNAYGRFRWAECQLLYICDIIPERVQHALANLPATLDETYRRTLREINNAEWELAYRLFQFVAVASRPLRVDELAPLLAFNFEAVSIPNFPQARHLEDQVYAVLSACPSLLAIVDGGYPFKKVVQFSHYSVMEFLTSARLAEASDITHSRYHISMTPAHTIAAQACLGILLHLDKDVITSSGLEEYPLAEYAAEHWADHARFEDASRNVDETMKRLFDPSKPHLAICVWIHDPEVPTRRRAERAERPLPLTGSPLHYAALWGLGAMVEFLVVEHSQDVHSQGFTNMVTPLHLALKWGHVEVARSLCEYGADVTALDKNGWNPLHLALSGGHAELVRIFTEDGIRQIAQGKDRWTPLHRVPFKKYIDVAEILFSYGADVTAEDRRSLTPLHLASGGHVKLALILLERVDAMAQDWFTPLHRASSREHVDLTRILLERGADVIAQDKNAGSPLHWASSGGDAEIARILFEHGAHADARDNDNCTPLHRASQQAHPEVVCFLLEHGADAGARDNDNCTPLHWASQQGHQEIVRILIEHCVDADARDNDNCTPLHWASQQGHSEVVRDLVEHGVDVDARDNDNCTPLHRASQQGHSEVVRDLIEHGADADARDDDNCNSLHRASQPGHFEVVRVLVDYGIDVNAQDHSNWTPLHGAAQYGHLKVVQFLLEHGANAHSSDQGGWTPLQWPSYNGDLEIVRTLLEYGADANTRDNNNWTPLHGASQQGHREVVQVLLAHGADANCRDDSNQTPLHLASRAGQLGLVRLLVESSANIYVQNNAGRTPVEEALVKGHDDVAELLMGYGTGV